MSRKSSTLAGLLETFFGSRLVAQRNATPSTIASYRDALRLFVLFAARRANRRPDALAVRDLDREVVLGFLDHLERKRGNGAKTRNSRLTAIRSFFRHVAASDPGCLGTAQRVSERFARRQIESAPIVAELKLWNDTMLGEVEPKSMLGKALTYIRRQWERLTRFLRDPLMDLTNNEVERDLRRWVLNRKVWMFVGHDVSARRAADALTLLTTCRKMGVEPRRYLRETLAKILAGEQDPTALAPETFARKVAAEKAAAAAAACAAAA